MTVCAHYQ